MTDPGGNGPSPRPTVLIIDDDRMLGRLAAHVITKATGGGVVLATTAEEGLALATDVRPDLVLLDVWIGETDGTKVLEELRARSSTSGLHVAMLSGEDDPDVLARCAALGAVDLVRKPFQPRELGDRVRALLGEEGEPR